MWCSLYREQNWFNQFIAIWSILLENIIDSGLAGGDADGGRTVDTKVLGEHELLSILKWHGHYLKSLALTFQYFQFIDEFTYAHLYNEQSGVKNGIIL